MLGLPWLVPCIVVGFCVLIESRRSRDSHLKFIFNHSDHVQVVRCISALKNRRESCLQLLDDGRISEIMPEGYIPIDYNLLRIMGGDMD